MAFYGIEVVQLVEAGFIKPGASSNPGKTKSDMLAVVLADGRIRTADGQVFNALSPAGAHVKGTKASPGWDFWHIERDDVLVPLRDLRDEFVRARR